MNLILREMNAKANYTGSGITSCSRELSSKRTHTNAPLEGPTGDLASCTASCATNCGPSFAPSFLQSFTFVFMLEVDCAKGAKGSIPAASLRQAYRVGGANVSAHH